jgi:hypothetical protein
VHFVDGGSGVDALDPGVGMGPARIVEVDDPTSIKPIW